VAITGDADRGEDVAITGDADRDEDVSFVDVSVTGDVEPLMSTSFDVSSCSASLMLSLRGGYELFGRPLWQRVAISNWSCCESFRVSQLSVCLVTQASVAS